MSEREKNILHEEINRINILVLEAHNKNGDYSSIKSDILTADEIKLVIDRSIANIESKKQNPTTGSRVIFGSIAGAFTASLTGGVMWAYSIYVTGARYYLLSAGLLIMSYLIIRLFTKQSPNNGVVLSATFISVILALILGSWIIYLISE